MLGTAQKSIITSGPISSVVASSGSMVITPVAANSYIKYGIHNTPF